MGNNIIKEQIIAHKHQENRSLGKRWKRQHEIVTGMTYS
jgi:hypothetical protein